MSLFGAEASCVSSPIVYLAAVISRVHPPHIGDVMPLTLNHSQTPLSMVADWWQLVIYDAYTMFTALIACIKSLAWGIVFVNTQWILL